jgi:predicted nucleic acid-binding protein
LRTAIDTNVISAIWTDEPSAKELIRTLRAAKSEGALLISPVVYVELHAYPGVSEVVIKDFLADSGIRVDFSLKESVWEEAGRRFAQYANRRRRSGSGDPKRLLADFLVGAHALLHADRLLSLDEAGYRQDFPELKLIPTS